MGATLYSIHITAVFSMTLYTDFGIGSEGVTQCNRGA